MLNLFPYQEIAVTAAEQHFNSGLNHFVLAASPSSGKTRMSLAFVQRNKGQFLIITHGQNVLKDMWQEEINALSKSDRGRVTYGIPQGLRKKDLKKFDYIIIDEAHEFTFAAMVQDILKVNPQAKIMYLTGTPSKFIAKKYHVHVIPAIDLIKGGYVSDLYIGLFSTTANIKDRDRNKDLDLTVTSSKKLESSVDDDMNELLTQMVKRLKSAGFIKKSYVASNVAKSFPDIFGKLHKTMIACASIRQAEKVHHFLNNTGVNATLSNSVNDPESVNIIGDNGFLKNPDIKVLVVVDRGILGFNMPELVNVVDMTGSHNINRIYQLYARVMRKNNAYPDKFFFKLAQVDEKDVTKWYMSAAVCLLFGEFISKYNGKNLDEMSIPVKVSVKRGTRVSGTGKLRSKRSFNVPKELFETVRAANMMEDIWNHSGKEFNEYARVTFRDIRFQLRGVFDLNSIQGMIDCARAGLC